MPLQSNCKRNEIIRNKNTQGFNIYIFWANKVEFEQ